MLTPSHHLSSQTLVNTVLVSLPTTSSSRTELLDLQVNLRGRTSIVSNLNRTGLDHLLYVATPRCVFCLGCGSINFFRLTSTYYKLLTTKGSKGPNKITAFSTITEMLGEAAKHWVSEKERWRQEQECQRVAGATSFQ